MNAINAMNHLASTGSLPVSKKDAEADLKRQKKSIEKKLDAISNDQKLTDEERTQEETKLSEKLRSIEDEIRSASVTKNQEGENATRNKRARSAASDMKLSIDEEQKKSEDKNREDEDKAMAAKKEAEDADLEAGVIVSLSANKTMLENMEKVRTKMNGELLTAESDEERAAIQKKLSRIESKMTSQVKEAKRNLDRYQASKRDAQRRAEQSAKDREKTDLSFLSEKENLSTNSKSDSSLGIRYSALGPKDRMQVVLN